MKKLVWLTTMAIVLAACSSIECPLNNAVYATYSICKADGTPGTLKDTLTIVTKRHNADIDTVLLNRSVNTTTFKLPMSYSGATDIIVLQMVDEEGNLAADTITISKTNKPHFESTECGPAFFHTIEGVISTSHKIESVTINDTEVTYDTTKEHFSILFKSGD